MLSKPKLQTSSPAAAAINVPNPSTLQPAKKHPLVSMPYPNPLSQGYPSPPKNRSHQMQRQHNQQEKSPINSTKPPPPSPSTTYGVCVPWCSLYSVGTPDPISLCKKKRLMSLSVYIRSLPPSNPIHSVSPSYGHSVSIVVRWGFICCGAVSQQKGVIREWWQAVCRGVLIKSSSERRCFTPSRAAAASRQWWMLLVAVRGTFASPAPRRIRPSGILPSLRCWRTPFRRGGV